MSGNLPVSSPRTFSVGEIEVGAYLNSLRDALNFLINPPFARIFQATPQSVANATNVAVTMDGSTADTYGGHSTSVNPSRYVAQVAGYYKLGAACAIGATSTTLTTWAYLAKNGSAATPIIFSPAPLGGNNRVWPTSTDMVFLAVGDYVELYVNQNDGGARNTVVTATQFSTMWIKWDHA